MDEGDVMIKFFIIVMVLLLPVNVYAKGLDYQKVIFKKFYKKYNKKKKCWELNDSPACMSNYSVVVMSQKNGSEHHYVTVSSQANKDSLRMDTGYYGVFLIKKKGSSVKVSGIPFVEAQEAGYAPLISGSPLIETSTRVGWKIDTHTMLQGYGNTTTKLIFEHKNKLVLSTLTTSVTRPTPDLFDSETLEAKLRYNADKSITAVVQGKWKGKQYTKEFTLKPNAKGLYTVPNDWPVVGAEEG
jgi:hypothetical protein